MANTLTNMISDAYAALNVVSRELVGFIPAVQRNPKTDRVGKNQVLFVPIAPANTSGGTITPAMSLPSAADQVIGSAAVTISNYKYYPFSWSAEEQYALDQDMGPGYLSINQQQIAEAMRAAVNEIESSVATAAYQGAARAYGSAATTPFGTAGDYTDAAQTRKILDDNGAPMGDRALILSTSAGANLRAKQAQAHMYGDTSLLRQGVLLDIHGFAIRESAQVVSHTAGTANATAAINSAGYAVGATTLTLGAPYGTGTFVTGDIITHARDTGTKYVIKTGDADISNGGTVVLNDPGIKTAITTASSIITTTASYTANVAFSRSAVLLATRLPEMGDDLANGTLIVTDPLSGISFEVRKYPGYGMGVYHLCVAWGVSVLKPAHVAVLIG